MRGTILLIALFVSAIASSACGGPPRDRHVTRTAAIACDRFDECGNLDEYGYSSYTECLSNMESSFYDLWPEDECGDGAMDRRAVFDCQDRAAVYACDANVFDLASFIQSCDAESVCTVSSN